MVRGRNETETQKWFFLVVLLVVVVVVVFLPAFALSTTNSTDLSAVVDMLNSLKNTGTLQKWRPQGGDPCGEQWVGIVCVDTSITEINLSKLGLSGGLGYSLQKLVSLEVLDLSDNNLTGKPPPNLPPNLRKLNFARSGLSGGDLGPLYSMRDHSSLTYLNFAYNQITGSLISDIFRRLGNLTFLDLSFNNFTGKIPDTFSSLSNLTTLYLQSNMLTGDLNVLSSLSKLEDVNVANNQFTGSTPAIFSRLPASNYQGNNFTVGPPGTQGPGQPSPPSPMGPITNNVGNGVNENASLSQGSVAGIVVSAIAAVVAFTALILFFLRKKETRMNDEEKHDLSMASLGPLLNTPPNKVEKDKQAHTGGLLKPPPVEWFKAESGKKSGRKTNKTAIAATQFSIGELQVSTNNFGQDNLVGEGALGRVYKADMPNGKVVAVKKVDSSVFASLQKEEDFTEIVSNVSRLRHSNIAELIGYCTEHGQRVLVYDYFHKGSLHDLLHDADVDLKGELSWNVRVKIALGTARAIEYLHEVCMPAIVHKNIKAANLLLDEDLNPHVADCGIAAFSPSLDPQVSTQMLGSLGYSAPEYAMSGLYTVKSDVYSFGVVMLELLTGRKPVDSSRPRAEQSLVRWATPQLHDIDALANMIDPSLNGNYPAKSLSRFADIIALCVQPEPEFRPPMSEVVQSLVRLVQRATVGNRRPGEDQRDSDPSDF